MFSSAKVKARLNDAFPDSEVEVIDLTGTSDHFQARIVTEVFRDKTLLERHRLVYAALGEAVGGAIHALTLETYTPEAWAAAKEKKRNGSAQ